MLSAAARRLYLEPTSYTLGWHANTSARYRAKRRGRFVVMQQCWMPGFHGCGIRNSVAPKAQRQFDELSLSKSFHMSPVLLQHAWCDHLVPWLQQSCMQLSLLLMLCCLGVGVQAQTPSHNLHGQQADMASYTGAGSAATESSMWEWCQANPGCSLNDLVVDRTERGLDEYQHSMYSTRGARTNYGARASAGTTSANPYMSQFGSSDSRITGSENAIDVDISANVTVTLTSLQLEVVSLSSNQNSATATIAVYADNGGFPGQVIYSVGSITSATTPLTRSHINPVYQVDFPLTTPVALAGGTGGAKYWISVSTTSASPTSDIFMFGAGVSTGATPVGTRVRRRSGSSAWGNSGTIIEAYYALSLVEITAPADLCAAAGVQSGLSGGTPVGGVYSGSGVTDNGNGLTYSFDPTTSGVGTHAITYTVNGNSASDAVEVFVSPTLSGANTVCAGETITLTGSTAASTSVPAFTSSNTSAATVDMTGVVTGVASGSTTIMFTDANGCTATSQVTVNALPQVSLNDPADQCEDGSDLAFKGSPLPTGTATGTATGTFSTTATAGFTDNGDGSR